MASQQKVTLPARGLYSFPNILGAVPEGALTTASNVVIDRDSIITSRRGFKVYGDTFGISSNRARQLLTYKDRVLRHFSTTLQVDSNGTGTFTDLQLESGGDASVTEPSTGTRIKYIEANGNLYFTSTQGIRKISCLDETEIASKYVTLAGGIKALDGIAILNPTSGWFTQDSTVAYRILWGIKDENSNLIPGTPSERIVINNPLLTLLLNDYNRLVADLSIVASVAAFAITGDTTNGSPTVSNITTTDLSIGMTVTGTGIPADTRISDIPTATTITLSKDATATNVGVSLTFGQELADTDYASLQLASNSTAAALYEALKTLAYGSTNKLDTDLNQQLVQISSVTAVAGANFQATSSSDYFDIYSAQNETKYRVWFQSGTSVAPDAGTAVLVPILIAGGDTNAQVATKISTALNNTGDFTTSVLANVVTVTNVDFGLSTSPLSYVLDSGFTVAVTQTGIDPTFAEIELTPSTEPGSPATSAELTDIQTYFDNIVNALNVTEGISTYAKQSIGGAFSNSSQSATTNIIFTIPEAITENYFYQIYRTAIYQSTGASTLSDLVPDDELRLIFEGFPTAAELSAGSVNFYDNIPDSFRVGGANLYTNANSGEGIAQANEPPPLARDIAQFKFNTFFANTQTRYKVQVSLLTATDLAGRKLTISQGSTSNTYTFVENVYQVTTIDCIPGTDFTSSGTADYFDIYSGGDINHYRIWFNIGTATAPAAGSATLVECAIETTDTAIQVAAKLQQAISELQCLTASIASDVVTVTNTVAGYTTSPTDNVANASFVITVTTSGAGESASLKQIGVSVAATPAQQVDETARSLVRIVNKNADETIYGYYISGTEDLPGLMSFESRNLGDAIFYIVADSDDMADKFNPSLGYTKTVTSNTIANPTVVTSTAHGLSTGAQVVFSGSNCTPTIDGLRTVTVIDANTFSVPVNVTVAGTAGAFTTIDEATQGDNEVVPNRLYFSKTGQPEATPSLNYYDIGPKNKNILRILPLRDSLFILSEAGIYRLAGDNPNNFQVSLFDNSTIIKSPDSAVILNNEIYVFTNQGITAIGDTGVVIKSRQIENKLLPLITSAYTNFYAQTFAVSYESDNAYLLFTVFNTSDTYATICYRFNTLTQTWTSWDVTKTCGVVDAEQDLLYLGAGDINSIEVERKAFTRLDYTDREYTLSIPNSAVDEDVISMGGNFSVEEGDVFVQTQRLTISQFNRLLRRLDMDAGLDYDQYYDTLNVSSGVNLRTSLTSLATQLDADAGLATHTYVASISGYGSTFQDCQDAFNVIVGLLNADANTRIKNYKTSSGTVRLEAPIDSVNNTLFTVTLKYALPLIVGEVIHYKKIDTEVTWAPHHFGDASLLKQVTESTLLFENVAFTDASANYASDLSPGFELTSFSGEGTGIWGGFDFGEVTFGGAGSSRPLRTFIPVKKQRCRYISGQFTHSVALEEFSVLGISYTYSPISSRAYR